MNGTNMKALVILVAPVLVFLGLAIWGGAYLGGTKFKKQFEGAEVQLKSATVELSQLQSASSSLQEDKEGLQTQLKSVQADLSQLRSASASLQNDKSALQTQLDTAQADLSQLRSASANLKKDNDDLQTQVESVQADLSQAQSQIATLTQNNASLDTQFYYAKTELSQVKSRSASLEESLASSRTELSQSQARYASLENRYASLKTQLASVDTQLSQAQSAQIRLQQENTALRSELAPWYAWLRSIPSLPTAANITTGPSITLSPTSGVPGTTITVNGSGFTANAYGQVFIDINRNSNIDSGEPIQVVQTSSTGTFSITLIVPSVTAGTYPILVSLPIGQPVQALATFTATTTITTGPSITLSPTSGLPGTTININGNGFEEDTSGWVFIDINRNNVIDSGEPYQIVRTSSSGTFSTTLTVPSASSMPPGTYTIAVLLPIGQPVQALATFTSFGG